VETGQNEASRGNRKGKGTTKGNKLEEWKMSKTFPDIPCSL